jgi:uncharacterized protein (DUF433 family)
MATATTWISKKTGRCGGDACVRDTRITVWGLEAYRRLGMAENEILSAVPGLSSGDLDAAWEYVAKNKTEMEQAICENKANEELRHQVSAL